MKSYIIIVCLNKKSQEGYYILETDARQDNRANIIRTEQMLSTRDRYTISCNYEKSDCSFPYIFGEMSDTIITFNSNHEGR